MSTFLFGMLLMVSCTEPIKLDLNTGDNLKLVVDAWIDNTSRAQFINLGLTTDYFDQSTPDEAIGAIVQIIGDGDVFDFDEVSPGRYQMIGQLDGPIGTDYELSIDYKGKNYAASHRLNRVPEAKFSAELYVPDAGEDDDFVNGFIYDFFIDVIEPAGLGDYYYFNSFKKGEDPVFDVRYSGITSDQFIDGAEVEKAYVSDGIYEPGDEVVVQMRSISKEAYDYILALSSQTADRGFIFDTPPANVSSNLSGGARGFFIVSAIEEGEVVIP